MPPQTIYVCDTLSKFVIETNLPSRILLVTSVKKNWLIVLRRSPMIKNDFSRRSNLLWQTKRRRKLICHGRKSQQVWLQLLLTLKMKSHSNGDQDEATDDEDSECKCGDEFASLGREMREVSLDGKYACSSLSFIPRQRFLLWRNRQRFLLFFCSPEHCERQNNNTLALVELQMLQTVVFHYLQMHLILLKVYVELIPFLRF